MENGKGRVVQFGAASATVTLFKPNHLFFVENTVGSFDSDFISLISSIVVSSEYPVS